MKRITILILLLVFGGILSAQPAEPFMLKTFQEEGFRKPHGEQYQSLHVGIAYDITITIPVWDGQMKAMETVVSAIRDSVMRYSLGSSYIDGDNYLAKAIDRYIQGNLNWYSKYDMSSVSDEDQELYKCNIDISSHGRFVGKDFVQYNISKYILSFDSSLHENKSFVFDANTGKVLRVKDFFKTDKETELALVQMLKDSIEAKKEEMSIGWLDFLFPDDIYEYTDITISKEDICFSFSSGGVMLYPCIDMVIPKQGIKKFVKKNCKLYSFWYGK